MKDFSKIKKMLKSVTTKKVGNMLPMKDQYIIDAVRFMVQLHHSSFILKDTLLSMLVNLKMVRLTFKASAFLLFVII